jgi:hypothetical protein
LVSRTYLPPPHPHPLQLSHGTGLHTVYVSVRVRVSGTITTYWRVIVFVSGTGRITVTVCWRCSVVYSTHGIIRFSYANVGTQMVRSTMRGPGQHESGDAVVCGDASAGEAEAAKGCLAVGADIEFPIPGGFDGPCGGN